MRTRLQDDADDAGEIASVLKKATADTNLSVKMLALGIISKIATGMGRPFDKHTRLLTAPVASVCADQKASMRTAALATLSAIADAIGGMDAMYTGLATSLGSANPALRAAITTWIAERLQAEPPTSNADMTTLAAPVISCLEDRNGDVRKGAGGILPFLVASAGFDFVMDQAANLKPASRATIVPLINVARSNAPAATSVKTTTAPSAGPSKMVAATEGSASMPGSPARAIAASSSRSIAPPARSLAMKALSSVPATRPASNHSDDRPTGIAKPRVLNGSRPASAASHTPAALDAALVASGSRTVPFVTSSMEARSTRIKRDAGRWILDNSPKAEMIDYLAAQMETHTSPEMLTLLFSKDHRAEEDYMAGLSIIAEFYDDVAASVFGTDEETIQAVQLANVDLALKYAALKLLSNNTQLGNRCLEVITHVVDTMPKYNERFSDAEAKLFVPGLIIKVTSSSRILAKADGHLVGRFQIHPEACTDLRVPRQDHRRITSCAIAGPVRVGRQAGGKDLQERVAPTYRKGLQEAGIYLRHEG